MNATRRATKILLREVNQKQICFAQKTAWFSPRAEQTDSTQACHRPDVVAKYLVNVDGSLEVVLQQIFAILEIKKQQF